MKKPLLILAAVLGCLLAGNLPAFAAHLVGGELSYLCLGGDNYRIELVVYRDCNCVSCADFDDPAHITIFDGEGNFVDVVDMFSPDIVEIPIDTEELCLENAPDVCIQRANYELEVSLPASSTGYQLVYQRCCRNNTIANLLDPGAQGSTYVIGVPPARPRRTRLYLCHWRTARSTRVRLQQLVAAIRQFSTYCHLRQLATYI